MSEPGYGPPCGGCNSDLTCDRSKESRLSPVPHDYEHVDEEYDSLGNGGSYDVLRCRGCGRVAYSMMAD